MGDGEITASKSETARSPKVAGLGCVSQENGNVAPERILRVAKG